MNTEFKINTYVDVSNVTKKIIYIWKLDYSAALQFHIEDIVLIEVDEDNDNYLIINIRDDEMEYRVGCGKEKSCEIIKVVLESWGH